ncbi:Rhodanese-like protein [Coemansia reversa NRRL 1564]|uniref:Rhodanese-like protein n=1 Tax=Coemansia reversa (strain ATCC 12441 / NRRL 1564) TaxID=763665 RepID=A0A2G5B7W1_COERN|nr:Rhodanese-like protein [Coemansia reversa NRRL 1564]|eukprot:PIA15099.1 Rhodanese-like protein [Coemansia reversa NRRL 1564]
MSSSIKKLVSVPWLHNNIRNVKVLDCSWYLPFLKRDVKGEFLSAHIPGAQFFDIDGIKDQSKADLPHMLPPPEFFGSSMDKFGISNDDHIVVYDTMGVGPACRVFWTFHAMGHSKVSVLNGGLPAWAVQKYSTEKGEPNVNPNKEKYTAHPISNLVCSYTEVVKNIGQLKGSDGKEGMQIVDARPHNRFTGAAPEFRPGLSSGHMPYAFNVPFTEVTEAVDLKNPQVQTLKPAKDIRNIFTHAGVDLNRPIITSCGSGVTASVLYFALLNAGVSQSNLTLYDGSWTEYALNPYSEIVKDVN